MENNTTADDHFIDSDVFDPVVSGDADPELSSVVPPPDYVTSADFKKEKAAHLVGKEWKDRKKDGKKEKEEAIKSTPESDQGGHGGGGMQSTVIISVMVVAVLGVLVAVTRKCCAR